MLSLSYFIFFNAFILAFHESDVMARDVTHQETSITNNELDGKMKEIHRVPLIEAGNITHLHKACDTSQSAYIVMQTIQCRTFLIMIRLSLRNIRFTGVLQFFDPREDQHGSHAFAQTYSTFLHHDLIVFLEYES